MKTVCVHCETRTPFGSRRLCKTCMNTPGVREMYPLSPKNAKFRQPGYGLTGTSNLPRKPTAAPVGSVAKLKVMSERAKRGLVLFHPDDSQEVQPCPAERSSTTRPLKGAVKRRSRRPSRFGQTPTGSGRSCWTRSGEPGPTD